MRIMKGVRVISTIIAECRGENLNLRERKWEKGTGEDYITRNLKLIHQMLLRWLNQEEWDRRIM